MSTATLARSIARATAPTQQSAGMALRAPGTLAGAVASPLGSYQAWLSGAVANTSLPRPALDFLTAAFSPSEPISPFPIDLAPLGSNRPEPRRQDYPVAINLPHVPGYGKLVDFAQLRAYADVSSVARACIRMRVDEVLGLEWDLVPTKAAHERLRGNQTALQDFQGRRDEAMRFWRRPDPNYFSFASWFKAAQEEKFVLDALSLYLHPTRVPGKGPFGSDLAALELLSGDTIYPLVDVSGASPRPPAPAYQQYIKGVPRVDLMTVIDEADQDRMDDLGAADAEFRGDQLLYLPYTRRAWTMYGFPPMEQAILPIITSVRRQEFRLQFFTEGTIPGLFITAPDDWTAKQIRQLQDALNAIGVGQEMRWRHIVLPGGSDIQPMKPNEIATEADATLAEDVMMAFDVKPMEMGTLPGGKSTGMGSGDMMQGQAAAGRRHSLRPDTRWWEGVFTFIIQEAWRQRDMRFSFLGLEDQADETARAQVHVTYVNAGILSRDEVRLDIDKEPWGFEETKEPTITTASGVSPLDGAFEQQQQTQQLQAQQTKAQIAGAVKPTAAADHGQPAAKAAILDELEQLRGFLRHGNDAARFQATALDAETVATLAKAWRAGDRAAFRRLRDTLS